MKKFFIMFLKNKKICLLAIMFVFSGNIQTASSRGAYSAGSSVPSLDRFFTGSYATISPLHEVREKVEQAQREINILAQLQAISQKKIAALEAKSQRSSELFKLFAAKIDDAERRIAVLESREPGDSGLKAQQAVFDSLVIVQIAQTETRVSNLERRVAGLEKCTPSLPRVMIEDWPTH